METTLDLMCLTMVINDIDNVDIVSAMELAMSIYMTRCVLVCNCGFMFVFSGNYLLLVINSCSCKALSFGYIYILTCYNKVSFVHCDSVFNVQCNTCTEQKQAVLLYELPRKHAHTYF